MTYTAAPKKSLYAASAAGAADAVAMVESPATVYAATAPDSFNIYERIGAIPAAGDVAYTDLGAAAQLAADRAFVKGVVIQ